MAEQEKQQFASFARKHGAEVARANEDTKDKPPDIGRKELPAGIRNGVAKLSSIYSKEQTEEGKKCPKGEVFVRASAIVILPEEYKGSVTSVIIEMCPLPATQYREEISFTEQYDKFRSLLQSLGAAPCPFDRKTDPDGTKAEAYWFSIMKAMNDPPPNTPPIYVEFSTRGFKPDGKDEIVMHNWHGKVDPSKVPAKPNPRAGVTASSTQPPPNTPPPSANGQATQQTQATPTTFRQDVADRASLPDLADRVAALVEVAMNDQAGETDEGAAAQGELEKLAWAAGWTEAVTKEAPDWAAVGEMALNPPQASSKPVVNVGDKFLFAKRDAKGDKLVNSKTKAELPPQEVEVTNIDLTTGTCTVKTVKDGKDVIDLRSKKPVAVKFEWLELLVAGVPPY